MELNKQPQVLPDNSKHHSRFPMTSPRLRTPSLYRSTTLEPLESGAGGLDGGPGDPAQRPEIDKRCYDAPMDMIDGCYDAGLTPVICSATGLQDFQ